jgi:hypothetical protein
MKKNVGGADKSLRIIVGLVILALGIFYQSWWGLIGFVPLFTGFTGWCPAYLPFGLSTCKTKVEGK